MIARNIIGPQYDWPPLTALTKPRLRKVPILGSWICEGEGVAMTGSTPANAYAKWFHRYQMQQRWRISPLDPYRRWEDGWVD